MSTRFYPGQQDYIVQLNLMDDVVGTVGTTFSTAAFALYDTTDNTKIAKFVATGLTTGTTYSYTLPAVSAQLATIGNIAQTFSGNSVFSNSNGSFGTSTGTGTINVASGATLSGNTKTVNIGTGGVAGSTTTMTLGPAAGSGTITFNQPPVSATGYKIGTTLSSDVNTLDYYQEGSFTPAVAGTTTAGAGTYTTQSGSYTRIGNMVAFKLALVYTAHTGTGNTIITGLPFTASAIDCPVDISTANFTFTGTLVSYVAAGTTQITIASMTSGAAQSAVAIDTTATINISGTYFV